jgi:capsule polysaccharide export protein KpsE/RkpR
MKFDQRASAYVNYDSTTIDSMKKVEDYFSYYKDKINIELNETSEIW